MKISYVMNVLNGEPFIKYQIDSIYKFADEIIIVEAAYRKFAHATNNRRSKDSTLETIRSYPDIENKIKLIVNEGFYEDRMEMCNEFLKHVSGDVIWQVDSDEFYSEKTHRYIRKLFKNDGNLSMVSFNFQDYFSSTEYYIAGNEYLKLDDVNRVHRFNKGDTWKSQRPPALIDKDGKDKIIKKKLDGPSLRLNGHIMHHATMMFDDQIKDKYKYYNSMLFSVSKPTYWYENVWEKFNNKLCVAGFKYNITYLKRNFLEVPKELMEMINDIRNGKIENFKLRKNNDIEEFFSSSSYEKYILLAEEISKVPNSNKSFLDELFNTMRLIASSMHFIDFRSSLFAIKIICINFIKFLRNRFLGKKIDR